MMEHEKIRQELGALIDGELTPTKKEEVLMHIAECPECMAEYQELKRIREEFKRLDFELDGALADSVMEKIALSSPPKIKKTPFILRHAGLAASLIIIASLFLYTRFAPQDTKEENSVKGDMTLMTDKAKGPESYFEKADDVTDKVIDESSRGEAEPESSVIDPETPMMPDPETPMTPDPESPLEDNELVPMPSSPESSKDSIKEDYTLFSTITYSNSLSPTTSILVVSAEVDEVEPHIRDYTSVVNSERCITVDISAGELESILLKNSIEVVSSLKYKDSNSTAIYFE